MTNDDYQIPVRLCGEPALRGFVTRFLLGLGASDDEARIVADGLTTACLWWHPGQGQGLEKLLRYYRRVENGGIVADAKMSWVRQGASNALLDAAKGFGYVAAHRAMDRAATLAADTGIAMVGVRNSNHFGIAGYHGFHAASRGLIGWAMTNAGAEMAPTGSARPTLGTNPWGIAIPRRGASPLVLDMALTMSGKGMMRWLVREGLSMPSSWALTPDGRRTEDPAAAMQGPLLPIGDYKGFGLSLWTDVLAGVMTGSLFGLDVFQNDTHFDVGHMLVAIDPTAFMSAEEFDSRLDGLCRQIQSAPPIAPDRTVQLPGQREMERRAYRLAHGIPVDEQTIAKLEPLCEQLGIDSPF